MTATRADVARLAGVSPSTVTYVLTGERPTSRSTRERVKQAIRDLDYRPHRHASMLAARSVRVVGMLFRMQRSCLDANDLDYLSGLRQRLAEDGIDVLVPMMRDDGGSRGLSELICSRTLDAAVLMDVAPLDERERILLDAGVPTVLIGTSGTPAGAPGVDADFSQMLDVAVRHLKDLGHRRVLLLARLLPQDCSNSYRELLGSALRSASRHGVDMVVRQVADAVPAGAALLGPEGLPGGCTAVISGNPEALGGILAVAWARGITIPQDLSVMSVGLTVPRDDDGQLVTEVSVDRRAMGECAGQILIDYLGQQQAPPIHVVQPAVLTDHGSTAPVPG